MYLLNMLVHHWKRVPDEKAGMALITDKYRGEKRMFDLRRKTIITIMHIPGAMSPRVCSWGVLMSISVCWKIFPWTKHFFYVTVLHNAAVPSYCLLSFYYLFCCLIWHDFQAVKPIHQCVSNHACVTGRIAASPLAQDVVFVVLSRDFDGPVIKHIMMQILVSHGGVLANDTG